ncbi:MAG: DUF4407 domain-containing protein [Imperialibacter sp.]|uniref:DUF4407 domain-containing protein n=1 Tax=Imperialibacter sp. TaxID=2038411 RepID=UPI0032ED593B
MLKTACSILGEDYNLLKDETAESRKKVLLLSSVLFVPVILWFFQGFLLGQMILGLSFGVSLATAIVLSFLIFLLERAIIMAPKNWKMNTFRIFLGLLVASIGSIIIDEILFHNDINGQMVTYKKGLLDEELEDIENKYSPEVTTLKEQVAAKYATWNTAMQEVKAEADGTGGSGIKGVSEITKTKLALTEAQGQSYQRSAQDLALLEAKREMEKTELATKFEKGFSENSLLTRMKVMFKFISNDLMMMAVYIVITLILFTMEFLVVIIKSCSSQTHYEFKLQKMEEMARSRTEKIVARDLKMYNAGMGTPEAKDARLYIERGNQGYYRAG